ncbi:hypothetical protein D9M68_913970 [compost metagenome]
MTSVNVKMTTVMIPADESGTTTLTKAPKRLKPSIMAASSMSCGMALKKPIISQVQKGTVKLGYTSTSDHSESCKPSSPTIRENGMNRMVGGIR